MYLQQSETEPIAKGGGVGGGWKKECVTNRALKQNVVFTKTWNCLKMLCLWIINWNILKYLWRTDIVFSLFKERIHFKVWFLNINNINFVEKTQLQSTWLNNDIKHWFIYKNTKNVDWWIMMDNFLDNFSFT